MKNKLCLVFEVLPKSNLQPITFRITVLQFSDQPMIKTRTIHKIFTVSAS